MSSKVEKFSFSKIDCYKTCGWKYKLCYIDKRRYENTTIATALGTLIHLTEQRISEAIMAGKKPDYEKLIEDFWHCNIPKTSPYDREGGIFGVDIIRAKFPEAYFEIDKNGSSYAQRCKWYAEDGIYRQERFLKDHPEIELVAVEKPFEIVYEGHLIRGYIDRVMHYIDTENYIIDDIKTKAKLFDDKDLTTPLQHVIYSIALSEEYGIPEENITNFYDLPLMNARQAAGTKGFMKRGRIKLDKLFEGIEERDWTPHPSPLCAFCDYGGTNPNQPPQAKHLCPYYCLWTKDNKTYEVLNRWEGIQNHPSVMDRYLYEQCTDLDPDEILIS